MDIHTSETGQPETRGVVQEVKKSRFEKISFIIFIATLLIVPFAFIPDTYAPFEISKTSIAALGILLSALCISVVFLKKKNIHIPNHPIILALAGTALFTVISGFASSSVWKSFIGQGFEMGTVSFLSLMCLSALLAGYFVVEKKERLLHIYTAILGAFALLAIFHVIRLFAGPEFLSFGILNSPSASLIGSWNDLGIFAGSVFLLSYFGIKYLSLQKGVKTLLAVFLILSVFLLVLVNFGLLWLVLGLVFLILCVYEWMQRPGVGFFKRISFIPLAIALVSILISFQGGRVAPLLQKTFGVQTVDVSLSWQATLDIAAESLKEAPIFGAGPNRFANEYLRFKPLGINTTAFWSTEFSTGSGFIPTTLITTGLIGFALWVLFLALYVRAGFKYMRTKASDSQEYSHGGDKLRFMVISTFLTGLFFWIMNIVHTPSHAVFFLTFIFTGLFVAALSSAGKVAYRDVSKFGSKFALLAIILCISWIGVYGKKAIALSYFKSGIHALNDTQGQGVAEAEKDFTKALMFDASDVYYQALSEVTIMKITTLATALQAQGDTAPPEAVKAIPDLIASAVDATSKAIALDPTNYYNYVSQARISEVGASLGIPNAYENAKISYAQALAYNPTNPSLYLNLARLEASHEKMDEAFKNIGTALELKQNYTEAVFFLSQLQVSQGKIDEAITSVQYATQINPLNPLLHFQLGLLYYNDKQYQLASTSFAKAVELNPSYANAQYFLGLTLARLGRNPEAIVQFEAVLETNPDSQEVALIISNLKAGKSPFTDAKPPVNTTPEKRDTLPVKDKSTR